MSPRTSAPAYPWETLELIPRTTVRAIRALGSSALEIGGLHRGLSQVLGREVTAAFKRFCDPAQVAAHPNRLLHFSLEDDSLTLSVEIEAALADTIISGLLRQAPGVAGEDVLANAALRGFLGRIGVEAGRSSNPPVHLRFHATPPEREPACSVGVSATLLLDEKPYAVRLAIGRTRPEASAAPCELRRLAGIPLRLGLIGGACVVRWEELTALGVGDVLLPGAGFWMTDGLGGSLALGAEASTRAAFFEIVGERSAKLVGVEELPAVEDSPIEDSPIEDSPIEGRPTEDKRMPENNETEVERSVAEAVLDAPLLVRIEVASVSMTAAEFASLRQGAVIETDQRIGQLATLRVAGREVATGELVNVDGQLGVRIRKLLRGD